MTGRLERLGIENYRSIILPMILPLSPQLLSMNLSFMDLYSLLELSIVSTINVGRKKEKIYKCMGWIELDPRKLVKKKNNEITNKM